MSWHTVNMTSNSEVVLAQELGICIVNVAMITDYDAGLVGNVPEVTTKEVVRMFQQSVGQLHKVLIRLVNMIPAVRGQKCRCLQKPDEAYFFDRAQRAESLRTGKTQGFSMLNPCDISGAV